MADQSNEYDPNAFIVDYFLGNGTDTDLANNSLDEPVGSPLFQLFGPPLTAHFPQQMVPMQQPYNPQYVAPTLNQAVPSGYAFHPDIGYSWPAPFQCAALPIPAQQRMPNVIPFSAPTVAESTQALEQSRPPTNKKKRKYGPDIWTEAQAKRRAIGDDSGPRPVSRESADLYVQGRKTKHKSGTTSKPKKQSSIVEKTAKVKDIRQATVRPCECAAAKAVKASIIPRSCNEWIIFRRSFSSTWTPPAGVKKGTMNTVVSIAAGVEWKRIKDEEPAKHDIYKKRAEAAKKAHKEQNPGYKYNTADRAWAKFGKPDCTCGAYSKNLAEFERRRGGTPNAEKTLEAAIGEDEEEDGHEEEGEGEGDGHVMPCTRSQSRANSLLLAQAPIAPPFPDNFFDLDYNYHTGNTPEFDMSFPSQNAAAEAEWATYQNSTDAAEYTYEAQMARRSARHTNKTVRYAEELSDYEEDLDGDEQMANTTPREKRRPSPIATSRNASLKMSELVNGSPDGPASRTRSKSLSFDENMYQEASTIDGLFGKDTEDIGENITVATPMTGISNVSPRNRSGLALPIVQEARVTRSQSRSGSK